MPAKLKPVLFRFSPELYKQLQRAAKLLDIPASQFVREAVSEKLAKTELHDKSPPKRAKARGA